MKKTNLIIFACIFFGLGSGVTYFLSSQKQMTSLKDREVLKSVFSSGCEVGIMKYCTIEKKEDCRNFCILFVESQPQVMDLIIKGLEQNVK